MKKISLGWSSFNDTPKEIKNKKEECVVYDDKHCLCMFFEGMDNLPKYCKLKEEE